MKRHAVMLASAALLGAACTRQHVTIAPRVLLNHVGELREHGHADVELSPSGTRRVTPRDTFDVRVGNDVRKLRVAELMTGCPNVAPFAGDHHVREQQCLLLETTAPLPVETRLRPDRDTWKVVAGAVAVVLVVGVVVGYVQACKEPDDGC